MNAQVWFDGLICCGPVKAGGSNAYQKGLTDAILSGKVTDPDVLSVTDRKNKPTVDSDIVRFQGKNGNLGAYVKSYNVYVEEGNDQEKNVKAALAKMAWHYENGTTPFSHQYLFITVSSKSPLSFFIADAANWDDGWIFQ